MVILTVAFGTSYHQIVNFVRSADVVVTYVTNSGPNRYNSTFPTTIREIANRNKTSQDSKYQLVSKSQRERLASYLAGVSVPSKGVLPGCFSPHHFVYASKDKKHIQFSICFTCSAMEVNGTYSYFSEVNSAYLSKAEKLFGMKFVPYPLPPINQSENKVEISKGKGQSIQPMP